MTLGKYRAALAALAFAAKSFATPLPPVVLENAFLRVGVDADSGAVTRIELKPALRFPLIADQGAGIAGSGRLFAPWVESGAGPAGPPVEIGRPGDPVLPAARGPGGGRLSFALTWASAGLTLERRIRLKEDASEFAIEDRVRNESDRDRTIRVGLISRQKAESWRLADRSWIGNGTETRELAISTIQPAPAAARLAGSPLFWRQIEQYGTGLLARIESGGISGQISAEPLPQGGKPVQVGWRSDEFVLAARATAGWRSIVTVDEGGGAPDQRNAFAPVLVRADFAAAGHSGEPLTGFATAVSTQRRRVRITVATGRELARADLELAPGKVARLPVTVTPEAKGNLAIRVTVTEQGRAIGSAEARALIDGDASSPVWRTYARKMPEETYRGTWEQIGEKLARDPTRLVGPNSIEISVGSVPGADNGLPYYRRHLLYYADLLTGIARAMAAPPSRIFVTERDDPASPAACMDVAFYGPDGPINAFSKERDGPDFKGLGYVKVVPAKGYRFHIYMHYGINSEGLSISGATLNEDAATTARGDQAIAARIRSGGRGLPPRVGIWMLLASCRTVEEALAMMQDPAAPILMGSSNMLLLDRAGHAACVESAGFEYHVYRQGAQTGGFYVSGNYPHEADGRFKMGPARGWAENTMLREAFLRDYAAPRQGSLSLRDVMSIMQSHEAGGMCQHHYDNPGQLYTSCSFIAVTRTGDLWLSEGPPCETAYVRHTLDP